MYPPIIAKASSIKWSFEEILEESLFDLYITTVETLAH